MNQSQVEAVATADAHLDNTALPTYTALVKALRDLRAGSREARANADRLIALVDGKPAAATVTKSQRVALKAAADWGSAWHSSAGQVHVWTPARSRMIGRLQNAGLLDVHNGITAAGRAALVRGAA